jgi:hypothetical protein
MMKYGKWFLVKLLRFTFNFFLFIGLVFHEPLHYVLIMVLVMASITYVLGDLFILSKFGGTVALLLDIPLFFGGLCGMHVLLGIPIGYGQFFLFTLVTIALCVEEFIYHIYVERNVFGIDRPSLTDMINKL